jgi:hypothetical protein
VVHPWATAQPVGQVTNPGGSGQVAAGSQVTSQAHEPAQYTPPAHDDVPEQLTAQAPEPQFTGNLQLSGPGQLTWHDGASLQWSVAHAVGPTQSMAHGPLPQSTPKKQLESPRQCTAHELASPHWMSVLHPCDASQRTSQGMPAGHWMTRRSSPRMWHTPPAQPWLQAAGHGPASGAAGSASGAAGSASGVAGSASGGPPPPSGSPDDDDGS